MLKKAAALFSAVCFGVVGFFGFQSGAQTAAPYTFVTIAYPASTSTVASGIDITGRIVGYYEDASGTHGFVLNNGNYSSIDYPGAKWTAAYAVNNGGLIVGG